MASACSTTRSSGSQDDAQQHAAHATRQNGGRQEPAEQPQHPVPERPIGESGMAAQCQGAVLHPAVLHLSHARGHLDRQQGHEPRRSTVCIRSADPLEDHLPLGVHQTDAFVVPGIELRGDQQLDRNLVLRHLGERQCKRVGSVEILQQQLVLEVSPGGKAADQRAPAERNERHQRDREPELSYQRHLRHSCISVSYGSTKSAGV
jgi:hypothetical protein